MNWREFLYIDFHHNRFSTRTVETYSCDAMTEINMMKLLLCRCVAGSSPKEPRKDTLSPTRGASGKSESFN